MDANRERTKLLLREALHRKDFPKTRLYAGMLGLEEEVLGKLVQYNIKDQKYKILDTVVFTFTDHPHIERTRGRFYKLYEKLRESGKIK